MAGSVEKGAVIIVDGIASRGEARVINGRLLVRLVPTGTLRQRGVGSAQIKGGVASHNEAVVIDGALRLRF